MESPKPTTPLCRRTLMLAHVATQIPPATRPQSNAIHKRQVCCAFLTTRPPLSVSERGSAVLHARISYPHTIVTEAHAAHHLPQQLWSQTQRHAALDPATPTRGLRGRLRYRQPGQLLGEQDAQKGRAGDRGAGRVHSLSAREQRRADEPQHTFANKRRPRPTGKTKVANTNSMPTHPDPIVGGKPVERRHKFFSTPYLFAQCGAYSGGRPHAQEEDDRKAAHHLAIGAARRRIARSITQLEQHAKKTLPERNGRPGSPTTTEENSQP